ncbi:FHA domain-containing protein [Roseiconus lacunae]|uniref:FHA domain-containing protein n=1 Tax=Roseiconus lacunae TaxID=2605694 RepID=UPI001E343653|nr:FHA domain-containing protein [Roseiconus lacunae]MCD0458107.1 FHA domain-containing protein [Roseiconus lacunae]
MSRSTSPTVSSFFLTIHRPGKSSLQHQLEEGRSVFLGRGPSCGIHVDGDGVAEIHCLIDVEDDVVSVQDWASDAGTVIDGNKIEDKTEMKVGDSIVLGSVRVELGGGKATPAPREPDLIEETTPVKAPAENAVAADSIDASFGTDVTLESIEPAFDQEHDASDLDESIGQEDDVIASMPILEDLSAPEPSEPASSTSFGSAFSDPTQALDQDLDWDPSELDEEEVDPEVVALLRSEIEDLRIQLAERDEQLAAYSGTEGFADQPPRIDSDDVDFGSPNLADRVDELLAELEEHDDRVATLQELLQTAEVQNQAEHEERACLETWVSEIEQRIGQRESEFQAEQDALRQRLDDTCEERNKLQQMLHAAKQRIGGKSVEETLDDETLKELQRRNADLHSQLDEANKQVAGLKRQVERLKSEDPESVQSLRAELAKEKADVSRMRFQLSKQLEEIGNVPVAKDQPDREFAFKLKTLREHLREIHEEEKADRDQKGDSLFGRISNLWKRVDDQY